MSESEQPARRPADPPTKTNAFPPTLLQWITRSALWLLAMAATFGLAVAVLLGVALAVAYPNLPEISGLVDYRPKLPMRVFSADGLLLGEYGEERRNFVPLAQIPKVMQKAVLASEDARFYEHSGVDLKGVLRAGLAQFNRSRSQGASTITMQVARNFYLSTEKTYTRKIYEMLLAFKMERVLTKDQILEVYMNQIFLGQRAYGFASASEIYFGKPLKDVSIAEAAMLAGLPQAPSAYNPINNPDRARSGQLRILDRMTDNGYITPMQREAARAEELRYREPSEVAVHAEYVAETARQLIFSQYGEEAYTRGLNVYLTLNSADQMVAYRALRKGILDYERRQVYRGPEDYVDLPANPNEVDARIAEALQDHPDNDELKAAIAIAAGPKKVMAVLQSGETITIVGEGLKPVASGLVAKGNPKTQIRAGAVIRVVRITGKDGKNDWGVTQLPEVEGAFVAIDPHTGAVRALVGGFDYAKSKFNHVTQAWRQPGSSFKPFIYSAALEKGFTPATVVNDAPLFFDAGSTGSQPWEPKNYDGKFEGPMTMRRGLERSKNMVSIRILQSIGAPYAQNWITRFGFDADKHPAYLPIALGTGSVTPLQMASAYSVFASGGFRVNPMLISKITDNKGRVLNEATPAAPSEPMRTIEARNAFVTNSLLNSVALRGTAAAARRVLGRPDIYGKTGTTNDSIDTWFAGFQPSVVAVVWIGYDAPRKLGDNETGGGLSLPIWIEYMKHALAGVPVEQYAVPEGVVNIGDEWYYEEYTRGAGVASVGLEDKLPNAPDEDERKSILDLFKR